LRVKPESGQLATRRAALELFFWAAQQTIRLVLSIAFAIYAIVSLIEGELPGTREALSVASRLAELFR
jgi:hypothetical protein